MKVFVFDLHPYGHQFEAFKADRHIPYPLPKKYFDREIAAATYEEHIAVWREMDRLGFDGVGLNEHHTTPHGLMNSPNMMAAVAAQHTKNLKFLILGNLLPLHNPLRIAEELAMADCMSRGRVLSGFARGALREYNVYGVPMSESRARFEEAIDIIRKVWTEDVFNYDGQFWSYKNVATWPRPYQDPHPPIFIPFTLSKETIDLAGANNFSCVIPEQHPGLMQDILRYYAASLQRSGHRVTPDHIVLFAEAYVARDREQAIAEYAPSYLYFQQTLWHHGSRNEGGKRQKTGYLSNSAFDHVRPENLPHAEMDREKIRDTTRADVEERVESGALMWGSAKDVGDLLIEAAERAGANSLLLNLNLGALPNDMFMEQIRRFGREVLPRLQAHQVTRVPASEMQNA